MDELLLSVTRSPQDVQSVTGWDVGPAKPPAAPGEREERTSSKDSRVIGGGL